MFRVGLGIGGMKDQEAKDAKDAVNQAYIDRYDWPKKELPCFLAPKVK